MWNLFQRIVSLAGFLVLLALGGGFGIAALVASIVRALVWGKLSFTAEVSELREDREKKELTALQVSTTSANPAT